MGADLAAYLQYAASLKLRPSDVLSYRAPFFEGARAPSKTEATHRELADAAASLSKALLEHGDGTPAPKDGDLVLLHLTLRGCVASGGDEDPEAVLSTTRREDGGSGEPLVAVLGPACSLLRGVELALSAFSPGERAVLRIPPEFAFGAGEARSSLLKRSTHAPFAAAHPDCAARGLAPPRGHVGTTHVFADIQLLSFRKAVLLRAPPDNPGLLAKVIVTHGSGMETPHPPYEVRLDVAFATLGHPTTSPPPPSACFIHAAKLPSIPLGSGALPPCLEVAVASMRPGEMADVWASPEWAPAQNSSYAVLDAAARKGGGGVARKWPHGALWRVRLASIIQVRDLHGDGSLVKRRLVIGTGSFPIDCPLHDCTVTCRIAASRGCGGAAAAAAAGAGDASDAGGAHGDGASAGEAEAEEATWELGCGMQPPGLEDAIRLMVPAETASVTVTHPRHGYGATPKGLWTDPTARGEGKEGGSGGGGGGEAESAQSPPPPPPPSVDNPLVWRVTLVGFAKPLNWHAATAEDCIADAARSKAAGVALFKAGCWALARSRFERVAQQLNGLRGLEEADDASATVLRASCLLNAAACAAKLHDHVGAAAHATMVIERVGGSENAKAYFRRGVARGELGEWDDAQSDFDVAAAIDPGSAGECERAAARVKASRAVAEARTKSQLGGFLHKRG